MTLITPLGIDTWQARGLSSTIDLAFLSNTLVDRLIQCCSEESLDYQSDHFPICTKLDLRTGTAKAPTRRQWKKADWKTIVEDLENEIRWPGPIATIQEIDDAVAHLQGKLQEMATRHVPMARPSVRANPAWTKEVEELVHLARQARRRWTDSGLESDLIAYKAITNTKKRAIRRGTTRAWRAFADSLSNTNQVWRMTKWAKTADTVAATTPQFPPLQDSPDGELTYDRRERAEKLAKKFFPPPEPSNLDDIGNATYPEAVDITPEVTETMIMAALKRANPDKALGTDGITARMLKTCAKPLMPWLHAIFNACIRLGYHPEAFRASHTIVLRKPGKKHYTVAAAYRPVALLNTLGKILEGVIAETISKAV